MKKPKIEPSSDQRTWAKSCAQMFVALVDEGFTEKQALELVRAVLVTAAGKRP